MLPIVSLNACSFKLCALLSLTQPYTWTPSHYRETFVELNCPFYIPSQALASYALGFLGDSQLNFP